MQPLRLRNLLPRANTGSTLVSRAGQTLDLSTATPENVLRFSRAAAAVERSTPRAGQNIVKTGYGAILGHIALAGDSASALAQSSADVLAATAAAVQADECVVLHNTSAMAANNVFVGNWQAIVYGKGATSKLHRDFIAPNSHEWCVFGGSDVLRAQLPRASVSC